MSTADDTGPPDPTSDDVAALVGFLTHGPGGGRGLFTEQTTPTAAQVQTLIADGMQRARVRFGDQPTPTVAFSLVALSAKLRAALAAIRSYGSGERAEARYEQLSAELTGVERDLDRVQRFGQAAPAASVGMFDVRGATHRAASPGAARGN